MSSGGPAPAPRRPPLTPVGAPYLGRIFAMLMWTRSVESHHLLTGLQPDVRLADRCLSVSSEWRPQRELNPHLLIDNQPSWPLDDESMVGLQSAGGAGTGPAGGCKPLAIRAQTGAF